MGIQEACRKASELNRAQEASGSHTRYVVVSQPIGACDGDHQVVARTVRARRCRDVSR
jgi:hypothetical protein